MEPRKVIVTVAPTGGMAGKHQNPALPTQPDEIAECVARCCELGASIAAIHARRPDDEATCNPEIYAEINAKVRERCDIIVNNSTGGGVSGDLVVRDADGRESLSFEERLRGAEGAGAEMATADCWTMYARFGGKEMLVDTSPAMSERLVQQLQRHNLKPEWEVMNPAHILQGTRGLIRAGYDKPPYFVNIVLGMDRAFQGALPYTPAILQQMVDLLPEESVFCVSAIGPSQLPATTHGILLGGHVRVGLEDNNYYGPGQLATNEQLVERTVRIIRELGHEPATPAEAREMLGLAPVSA